MTTEIKIIDHPSSNFSGFESILYQLKLPSDTSIVDPIFLEEVVKHVFHLHMSKTENHIHILEILSKSRKIINHFSDLDNSAIDSNIKKTLRNLNANAELSYLSQGYWTTTITRLIKIDADSNRYLLITSNPIKYALYEFHSIQVENQKKWLQLDKDKINQLISKENDFIIENINDWLDFPKEKNIYNWGKSFVKSLESFLKKTESLQHDIFEIYDPLRKESIINGRKVQKVCWQVVNHNKLDKNQEYYLIRKNIFGNKYEYFWAKKNNDFETALLLDNDVLRLQYFLDAYPEFLFKKKENTNKITTTVKINKVEREICLNNFIPYSEFRKISFLSSRMFYKGFDIIYVFSDQSFFDKAIETLKNLEITIQGE